MDENIEVGSIKLKHNTFEETVKSHPNVSK